MQIQQMRSILTLALFLGSMLLSPLVRAADAEIALLSSYVGQWNGEGALVGGDAPEPFRCRLAVTKGNQSKINYTGRCTLVNANLSISGTIAFNDSTRRYEAIMSSNAGFTGLALGARQGDTIVFDLREQRQDRAGSDVRIGSKITLFGESISVDFEVEFNNSGNVLTAAVPFSR